MITQQLEWTQAKSIAKRFKTSLPPPHNPWFLDLPIEWVPSLLNVLKDAKIEHDGSLENSTDDGKVLRIIGGVKGWNNKKMLELEPEKNLADLENCQAQIQY